MIRVSAEPMSHVVVPLTIATARGRARSHRPPARPYDWSDEPELRLSLPEVGLIVAALRDLNVTAGADLAEEITRQLNPPSPDPSIPPRPAR